MGRYFDFILTLLKYKFSKKFVKMAEVATPLDSINKEEAPAVEVAAKEAEAVDAVDAAPAAADAPAEAPAAEGDGTSQNSRIGNIKIFLIVKYNFIQAKKYSNYKHLKKFIKNFFFYFSYNKSRNNFKDEINVAL